MIDSGRLAAFFALAVTLIAIPGPSVVFVVGRGVALGRRAGIATAIGNESGLLIQVLIVAAGLGALLEKWMAVLTAVKLAGAAYLVFLGVQALRGAWRGDYETLDDVRKARASRGRRFREGFLSNITNPKVIVLYLSVLPQFLTPGVTDQGDALLLAYTVAALGLVWQVLLLFFVHRVRGWLQRRRVRRTMDGATGVALVGFGAALALEG